ncbi:MAG: hypothetical protein ABIJ18_01720 [archaeon]
MGFFEELGRFFGQLFVRDTLISLNMQLEKKGISEKIFLKSLQNEVNKLISDNRDSRKFMFQLSSLKSNLMRFTNKKVKSDQKINEIYGKMKGICFNVLRRIKDIENKQKELAVRRKKLPETDRNGFINWMVPYLFGNIQEEESKTKAA